MGCAVRCTPSSSAFAKPPVLRNSFAVLLLGLCHVRLPRAIMSSPTGDAPQAASGSLRLMLQAARLALGRILRPAPPLRVRLGRRVGGLPRPCGLLQAAGLHAAAPLAFAALLGAQVRGFARSGFSACPVCACWVLRINRRHTIRVSCCRRHAFGVGGLVARYACACDRRAPLQGSYLVNQGAARPRAADVLADYPCGGGTRQPRKGG